MALRSFRCLGSSSAWIRSFASLAVPGNLRGSAHVELALQSSSQQLRPGTDGNLKRVGMGDRGCGLVYRGGRVSPKFGAADSVSAGSSQEGVLIVKVQPPVDNSSDSAGGIGRMMPTTLLLHDQDFDITQFVEEDNKSHWGLFRSALGQRENIGYMFAEEFTGEQGARMLRVFTEVLPPRPSGW